VSDEHHHQHTGPGYASPQIAGEQPPEHLIYVLSLDDRNLFLSNWLHGDLRHYDVSDPTSPELRSQTWLGGLLGRDAGHPRVDGPLSGGPQMLQCSLDGGFELDPGFVVDFHEQTGGARPHEIHLPGGDCTTEIFQ
jgi:methanethiol oxidase